MRKHGFDRHSGFIFGTEVIYLLTRQCFTQYCSDVILGTVEVYCHFDGLQLVLLQVELQWEPMDKSGHTADTLR